MMQDRNGSFYALRVVTPQPPHHLPVPEINFKLLGLGSEGWAIVLMFQSIPPLANVALPLSPRLLISNLRTWPPKQGKLGHIDGFVTGLSMCLCVPGPEVDTHD